MVSRVACDFNASIPEIAAEPTTAGDVEKRLSEQVAACIDLYAVGLAERGAGAVFGACAASFGAHMGACAAAHGKSHDEMQKLLAGYVEDILMNADSAYRSVAGSIGGGA